MKSTFLVCTLVLASTTTIKAEYNHLTPTDMAASLGILVGAASNYYCSNPLVGNLIGIVTTFSVACIIKSITSRDFLCATAGYGMGGILAYASRTNIAMNRSEA